VPFLVVAAGFVAISYEASCESCLFIVGARNSATIGAELSSIPAVDMEGLARHHCGLKCVLSGPHNCGRLCYLWSCIAADITFAARPRPGIVMVARLFYS